MKMTENTIGNFSNVTSAESQILFHRSSSRSSSGRSGRLGKTQKGFFLGSSTNDRYQVNAILSFSPLTDFQRLDCRFNNMLATIYMFRGKKNRLSSPPSPTPGVRRIAFED